MKAIILLGMTGNLLILVTVARSPAMRTTSNIYICNMAISGEDTGEIFNSLLEISELCNSQVWITLSVTISFLEIKSFQLFRHDDLPFPKFPRKKLLHLLRHGDIFAPAQTWWSAWRQPRWPPSPPSPAAGTLGGSHASCFPSFRLRTFYWKFLVLLKVIFESFIYGTLGGSHASCFPSFRLVASAPALFISASFKIPIFFCGKLPFSSKNVAVSCSLTSYSFHLVLTKLC